MGLAPHLVRFARNHSLLITGEPGAGKTEFIKLLLPQIRANPDEPVVVFDYKRVYREWAERRGDVVRISTRDSTAYWNVFREVRDNVKAADRRICLHSTRIDVDLGSR